MNRAQAKELFTLITTVRHVDKMHSGNGPLTDQPFGCLLCEGYRHGLYSVDKAIKLDKEPGFSNHFGCTTGEGLNLIFSSNPNGHGATTGENYYKAGKELIEKYGYTDLFDTALPFADLMKQLRQPVAA